MIKMKSTYIFLLAGLLIWLGSCQLQEEKITLNPSKSLIFSSDTIVFDTVFTTQKTATRRLRVRNPNKNAIMLSSVELVNGNASPFSVTVNGQRGDKIVRDVEIRGGDSILVLMEAKIQANAQDEPIIVEDALRFFVKGKSQPQNVMILAWGQDAIYLRDSILPCNMRWTKQKPYVIFEGVLVPKGCTLTVEAGARIHSYQNANILVEGTIIVQGTEQEPVIFEGTRLEKEYENQPNQWGAIALLGESKGNVINYAIIRNGLRGIQVNVPDDTKSADVVIANSVIKNMSEVGVFCFGSTVIMYNTEISDCAQYLFAGLRGGNYSLWHNTLTYSSSKSFQRKTPAVGFNNFYEDAATSTLYTAPYPTVELVNNIISGNQTNELIFGIYPDKTPLLPTPILHKNIIRVAKVNADRNFDVGDNIFVQSNYTLRNNFNYNFALDSADTQKEVAYQKGWPLTNFNNTIQLVLSKDRFSFPRPADKPDIGAYQFDK